MSEPPEFVLREMLGDTLANKLVEARTRTGDASIMCRIGDSPDDSPDVWMPGLASIERAGVPTVYGLSGEEAAAQLDALA
jgi:hypothetical protein